MSIKFTGGWIYVMMTSSDYGRFKVGRTKGNPLDRAKELRTGDPYLDLHVAYFVPASMGQLSKLETALHKEFDERIATHDESISEWFSGPADWAANRLESILEDWTDEPVSSLYAYGQGRICRAYEADLKLHYSPPKLHPIDGLPM